MVGYLKVVSRMLMFLQGEGVLVGTVVMGVMGLVHPDGKMI
tara:strand:+ start:551 stop:673 length:123 start_codon:yes stop_codon:yes gene_type:complete